jgi:hypothetical protein
VRVTTRDRADTGVGVEGGGVEGGCVEGDVAERSVADGLVTSDDAAGIGAAGAARAVPAGSTTEVTTPAIPVAQTVRTTRNRLMKFLSVQRTSGPLVGTLPPGADRRAPAVLRQPLTRRATSLVKIGIDSGGVSTHASRTNIRSKA